MFNSLEINGYRGLKHFEMKGLGRVNLLVGRNNSGKTSVLEAVLILASLANPRNIWGILRNRNEEAEVDLASLYGNPASEPDYDVNHLFHGHQITGGSFSISADNKARGIGCSVLGSEVTLILSFKEQTDYIPLTIPKILNRKNVFGVIWNPSGQVINCQYIPTCLLSVAGLNYKWDDIGLTWKEDIVLQAIRYVEPDIEGILPIQKRGGFKVKLKGNDTPVPIGSLGDGMWRALALAVALVQSKDGFLLVDEIDTGLHYSVMSSIWKMIFETAKKHNIQVFATTHSLDCVNSLASICREGVDEGSEVTIQRLEPEHNRAVAYTEDEISIAARRHIEVR